MATRAFRTDRNFRDPTLRSPSHDTVGERGRTDGSTFLTAPPVGVWVPETGGETGGTDRPLRDPYSIQCWVPVHPTPLISTTSGPWVEEGTEGRRSRVSSEWTSGKSGLNGTPGARGDPGTVGVSCYVGFGLEGRESGVLFWSWCRGVREEVSGDPDPPDPPEV